MSKRIALPLDIRLMNVTAFGLFVLACLVALGGSLWSLLRLPAFGIQAITVVGDVTHNNAVTLRANVMPHLSGNFFTLDLAEARKAFESVPWVRSAVVHREFPNRLRVVISEHEPIALWGDVADGTLVNRQADVFEAVLDDHEIEHLPRFRGPRSESRQVVQMYAFLLPLFEAVGMKIEVLELSARGSWRVETASGAALELGRGTQQEIAQRLQLFWRTLAQVTARYGRTPASLATADLRHVDGYALQLKGVTTFEGDGRKKP